MPDPLLILESMAVAALIAAVALLLGGWPWRKSHPARAAAGSVLGVGLGFFAGCWLLGVRPHWPPTEDQHRWLLVMFPVLIGVELLGAFAGSSRRLVWLLRIVIAAGAGQVLLHNTSYLADLAGPGSREWTPAQTWMILGGLAAALTAVWGMLALLATRAPGRSMPLSVAVGCAGAAVTVMLSGYSSGGQMGLPLAAAIGGALLASLVLSEPPEMNGILGLGVVGLFALVVIGRFFGQLALPHAALLLFAPLLCWLPELPLLCRIRPRLRGVLRVVLAAGPVIVALTLAQQKFVADSSHKCPGSMEPTMQDYTGFRP